MDETTEYILTAHASRLSVRILGRLTGLWRREVQPAMRSCAVVVLHVGSEDALQMSSAEDERPVQALRRTRRPRPSESEDATGWAD